MFAIKRIAVLIFLLCFGFVCGTAFAGTPVPPVNSVVIKGFTPQEIQRAISTYIFNWGWSVADVNDFQMNLTRKETDFGTSLVYGSQFNSSPESRVAFLFSYAEDGSIKVDAAYTIATNPNSGFEYTSESYVDEGSIPRLLLKHLEAIFNGTDGLGLDVNLTATGKGFKIFKVFEGSAADKAGIETGDIITKINGTNIFKVSILRILHVHFWGDPGHEVTLNITKKDGTNVEKTISIGHIPPQTKLLAALFPGKNLQVAKVDKPSPEVQEKAASPQTITKDTSGGSSETDIRFQELFEKYSDKNKN